MGLDNEDPTLGVTNEQQVAGAATNLLQWSLALTEQAKTVSSSGQERPASYPGRKTCGPDPPLPPPPLATHRQPTRNLMVSAFRSM